MYSNFHYFHLKQTTSNFQWKVAVPFNNFSALYFHPQFGFPLFSSSNVFLLLLHVVKNSMIVFILSSGIHRKRTNTTSTAIIWCLEIKRGRVEISNTGFNKPFQFSPIQQNKSINMFCSNSELVLVLYLACPYFNELQDREIKNLFWSANKKITQHFTSL